MDEHDQENVRSKHGGFRTRLPIIVIGFACFAAGFSTRWLARSNVDRGDTLNSIEDKLDNLSHTLEGRIDNLSRAVFALGSPSSRLPLTTDSSTEFPSGPVVPVVPVARLLEEAEKWRAEDNLLEAEILLTRAVQTDRDDISAWRGLAAVQREMSAASLAAGKLLSAAQEADRARTSVNGIRGLSVDPMLDIDPKIVTEEENAITKTATAVRDAIDVYCRRSIDAAKKSKDEGARWYRKNSRWWTVDGLKHLREVIELGPWASAETRMSTNEAFSALKGLVNSDEWNELLAQAGFDPSSRQRLKNWGLE